MKNNICFVIMGFGIKTDPLTGNKMDLNKTYQNIIKPAVTQAGYECVRADEIQESGIIDKSMYALLMHADLVIADISTYNPNAIYELGVRHAVRPYSTIIMKERQGKIPFDLDHSRMFFYTHLGEDIGASEAQRCVKELIDLINQVKANKNVDSPFYEYLAGISPPQLPKDYLKPIIKELAVKEKHLFALIEAASDMMSKNEFTEAAKLWEKAAQKAENEPYFIQQWALCTYKSKNPSEKTALTDALTIIDQLDPDGNTTDPETLGITGAIYKNLWLIDNDIEQLKRAIHYYGKCFKISGDYYTGENYSLCLDFIANLDLDPDEKVYYKIEAKKTRQRILEILSGIVDGEDFDQRPDQKWIYATLSHCNLALKNEEDSLRFEKMFLEMAPQNWEVETFEKSKSHLKRFKI